MEQAWSCCPVCGRSRVNCDCVRDEGEEEFVPFPPRVLRPAAPEGDDYAGHDDQL